MTAPSIALNLSNKQNGVAYYSNAVFSGLQQKLAQFSQHNPDNYWGDSLRTGSDGVVRFSNVPNGVFSYYPHYLHGYMSASAPINIKLPVTNNDGTALMEEVHVYIKSKGFSQELFVLDNEGNRHKSLPTDDWHKAHTCELAIEVPAGYNRVDTRLAFALLGGGGGWEAKIISGEIISHDDNCTMIEEGGYNFLSCELGAPVSSDETVTLKLSADGTIDTAFTNESYTMKIFIICMVALATASFIIIPIVIFRRRKQPEIIFTYWDDLSPEEQDEIIAEDEASRET